MKEYMRKLLTWAIWPLFGFGLLYAATSTFENDVYEAVLAVKCIVLSIALRQIRQEYFTRA